MPATTGLDDAIERAAALADRGGRTVLGVVGPPGSGKSTLAQALVDGVRQRCGPASAVVVGMDGFHLAQAELERLGRADRKGAPDTFDAEGFVALLRRLRAAGADPGEEPGEAVVYAPVFRRDLEEPIAGAVPVPGAVPLVVVEGNYLLLDGPWAAVRQVLDACWYVEVDDAVRLEQLVARHVAHGRSPQAAREWVLRSDEANAALVVAHRDRADLVVVRPGLSPEPGGPGAPCR